MYSLATITSIVVFFTNEVSDPPDFYDISGC